MSDFEDDLFDLLNQEQREKRAFVAGLSAGLKREDSFTGYTEFREWTEAEWDDYDQ